MEQTTRRTCALVSSTSPQLGHEALIVVMAALLSLAGFPGLPDPMKEGSAIGRKNLTPVLGTASRVTRSAPSVIGRQGLLRDLDHGVPQVGGLDHPGLAGQAQDQ